MTAEQTQSILRVLDAAFPSKTRRTEALKLYATLLADLDYELAGKAAKTLIETSQFWPKWAEVKRAYNEQAGAVRRAAEHAETQALLAEPTAAERAEQTRKMEQFIASRWPVST